MTNNLPAADEIGASIAETGYARIPNLLSPQQCNSVRNFYNDKECCFRSTINMARFNFGHGEYKYFDYPLPSLIQTLRSELYTRLAPVANQWRAQNQKRWPVSLQGLTSECHANEQTQATPLLLKYVAGDYNCLHQDLYGEVQFPLQTIVLLSQPGAEFDGGELILVEQRARRQSIPIVVPLNQGDAAVIPTTARPEPARSGTRSVKVRHGVSKVHSGSRITLGIIFHDAR